MVRFGSLVVGIVNARNGYRKLAVCLREDYGLRINHKKVYRLCKELRILRPQRIVRRNHSRRVARRDTVSGPNQLWEM
ncbi:MAG: IS3 family transposase, partial [Bacillota bacterium]